MIKTGIIGYPLEYTLSPKLHNIMFQYFNIKGEYLILKTNPEKLKEMVIFIKEHNYTGVNITMPFKEKIIEYLDDMHTSASSVGAVNTVILSENRLIGYNTDLYGFEKSLEFHRLNVKGKNIVLLGTGGVSKAVASIINKNYPEKFFIAGRDFNKTKKIAEKFNGKPISIDKIEKIIKKCQLLINATPLELTELSKKIERGGAYYDLKYNIKKLNMENDVKIIDGFIMLLYQGIESFYLWTKKRISINKILGKGVLQ